MLILTMTMVAAIEEQQNLDQYAKQPLLQNVHENEMWCICFWNEEQQNTKLL